MVQLVKILTYDFLGLDGSYEIKGNGKLRRATVKFNVVGRVVIILE